MIPDQMYKKYLNLLLQGDRNGCSQIVQELLDQDVEIKSVYTDLFQKSLYTVGELWECNRISVAKEHLATGITEGLLTLIYPRLFADKRDKQDKKVVISCAANEFHQIGGKIVADLFELHGWDGYFLGANTPVIGMLEYIQETKPDLVGLSLSVFFNFASLQEGLEAIRSTFVTMYIFVGAQAFRWGGIDAIKQYSRTEYIPSLDALEKSIK